MFEADAAVGAIDVVHADDGLEPHADGTPTTTVAHQDDAGTLAESSSLSRSSTASSATCTLGECFVCLDDGNDAPASPCKCIGRHIHEACLLKIVQQSGKAHCAVCASPYTNMTVEVRTKWRRSIALVKAVAWAAAGLMTYAMCAW
jgi:hypothetical protein